MLSIRFCFTFYSSEALTRQSLSTNGTIAFHFLYLQAYRQYTFCVWHLWAWCSNRQNNTLALLHRQQQTINKSSKHYSYLLLMDRFTRSLLCSEGRNKAGDRIRETQRTMSQINQSGRTNRILCQSLS